VARKAGVIAGLPIAQMVCQAIFEHLNLELLVRDGTAVTPGQRVARLKGPAIPILAAERTSLNFLQRLSGVASLTRKYVDKVAGTQAKILDTRKTTPGWRLLEKYAVRIGGGSNHRMGLYDAVLIKDNHLAALHTSPAEAAVLAVRRARAEIQHSKSLTIEVDDLNVFRTVLPEKPDIILLDNMTPADIQIAVQERNMAGSKTLLEASGGVNLDSIRTIAETGVDRISVGAITHSATALDIALDFVEE
jgi:nicotinate-nucleotide pyrophosphorylase (carboxylating)